jgi:predicted small lipoprotein YifL
MTQSKFSLASLLLIFLLVGCGQSGRLYLPGDPSEVQNLPSQLPQTPEVEPDEDDEEDADGNSDSGNDRD